MERRRPSLAEMASIFAAMEAATKGRAIQWGYDRLHSLIKIDPAVAEDVEGNKALESLIHHVFFAGALHAHRIGQYLIHHHLSPGGVLHPDDARRIQLLEDELDAWEEECKFEHTRQEVGKDE